jgi:outer membrane receptor for ferrienterochelin and colicins
MVRRPLRRIFIGLMVSLSSLCLCGPASAGAAAPPTDLTQLPIETLMNISVYGASKYEQKLMDAPAYVTIVNRDAIKKYGYRTLADVLRSVPGFFVTNDRNYQYLGVRGFNRPGDYNTRILLLVDGHRINDGLYDQAPIGTDFPIDLDLIQRVEVIRGPSSSIYGTNAFLAVVNVITRNGRNLKSDEKHGLEVSGNAGSFNSYKGRLTYGNQWAAGPELLVSASVFDSRGPDFFFRQPDNPAAGRMVAHNCDYDNFLSFFTKFAFRDFTLTGVYHSREKGVPTGAYGALFGDPRTRTVDTRAFVNLKYDHTFAGDWRVMARLSYNHYPYDGFYSISNITNPDEPTSVVQNRDIGRTDWWGSEVQVSKTFFDRHKVIVGNEYRDYFRLDQRNYDENPRTVLLDDHRTSNVWAFYAQDEITIFSNLKLNAGLRYDHYSTFGGSLNPRVALIYNPFKQTALKLLYGQAFRAPNAYELYYQDGGVTQKPNPDLKPEKISTYEVVWEQYFAQHYRFVASGYLYKINDLITQQTDPADGVIFFDNTDRVTAKGFTLELGGKWASGLEGRLSYAMEIAQNAQTGKILTNSPRHLPKLNVIVPLYQDKLFSGLEVLYLASRKGLNNSRVGDVVLANLTLLTRNVFKGWEFSASVYNLGNQKFRDPGAQEHLINGMNGIIQDGITFRVKLTYSY